MTSYLLANLTNTGSMKISGTDRKKFLQGQLTNNINNLANENGQLSAHCNPQGRIISLFRLIEANDDIYLIMPRDMIEIAIAALKKYAVFFKVSIADTSSDMSVIGFVGQPQDFLTLDENTFAVRIPSKTNRHLIFGSININKIVLEQTIDANTITEAEWKKMDIDEGISSLHPETSGIFLPHELNLDTLNAISFNKGCYTGQEIIARMHYRGKAKSRLHHATIESKTELLPGADVLTVNNNTIQTVGKIVDYCQLDSHCYDLLITVDENNASNTQLFPENNHHAFFTITDLT